MPVAIPERFDVFVRDATRVAIGRNNKTGHPARGRLLAVLKLYADANRQLDEVAFCRLLGNEFRAIPQRDYKPFFRYVSRDKPTVTLKRLMGCLLPDGFTKERSVLDFPCTFSNATTKHESMEEAAEQIRLEMIRHLRLKHLSMRDYFVEMDRDDSGTVDVNELIASLRHENLGIGRYHACKNLVRKFDRSGSGRMSFTDFESMLELTSPKTRHAIKLLERFGKRLQAVPQQQPRRQGKRGIPGYLQPTRQRRRHRHSRNQRAHSRTVSEGSARSLHSQLRLQLQPSRKVAVVGGSMSIGSYVEKSPKHHSRLPSPFNKNFELHKNAWSVGAR